MTRLEKSKSQGYGGVRVVSVYYSLNKILTILAN
nr:MAG TPA: hypothetical protein [Caudoviricetes sp.]